MNKQIKRLCTALGQWVLAKRPALQGRHESAARGEHTGCSKTKSTQHVQEKTTAPGIHQNSQTSLAGHTKA
jgi:hypothetical protein